MNPRQQQRAEELEHMRRAHMSELEDAFDHRNDGVAADRRFREKLRFHVVMFGDGTAGTSAAQIFGDLLKAERRLQRARAARR
jgi:hypothetical protein